MSANGIAADQRAPNRKPIFTFALIGALVIAFAVQCWTAPVPALGMIGLQPITLIREGGLIWLFVAKGQWWRLFTAPMLHVSFGHIAGNCLALVFSGFVLERLIGWRWYAASFGFSAVTGGLLSLAINPANMVSVGASGGILGLFCTTLIVAFHFETAMRVRLIVASLRIIVPSVLVFGSAHGIKTDLAAHFGGLVGGALIGLFLLAVWRRDAVIPAFGRVAVTLPVVFFLASAAAFGGEIFWVEYIRGQLDPSLPESFDRLKQESAERLKAYPRVRYAHAAALYDDDKTEAARTELMAALADGDMLALSPESDGLMRVLLSQIDIDAGQKDAAMAVVASICAAPKTRLRAMIADLCR